MHPEELTQAVAPTPTPAAPRRRRWLLPAVSAVVVAGVAIAVAVSIAGSDDSSTSPGGQSSGSAVAPTPREAAEAEAARLLSIVELPPGSTRATDVPDQLDAVPPPDGGTYVVRSATWRVPIDIDAVQDWWDSHEPTGFDATSGSGSVDSPGGGSGTKQIGISYSSGDPETPDTMISINAIPGDESGSSWRIDAVVKVSP